MDLLPSSSLQPDSSRLAALTPGFVGADIASMCNEAAIVAARGNKTKVELVDFESATDRIMITFLTSLHPRQQIAKV